MGITPGKIEFICTLSPVSYNTDENIIESIYLYLYNEKYLIIYSVLVRADLEQKLPTFWKWKVDTFHFGKKFVLYVTP